MWALSHRADPAARVLADRHYSRQTPGHPQFVQPGRCVVLLSPCRRALWVSSWPFGQFVKHAWPGAWQCSLFRVERAPGAASKRIRAAVAATRAMWGEPPALGMVTMVDPRKTPGIPVRGTKVHGFCFLKAGFRHVGETVSDGLWVWQLLPEDMPAALDPGGKQLRLAV